MEIRTLSLPSISEYQTREIARHFGQQAQCGDVFALIGELGAGKTVFAQGIATGFGIPEHYPITSPTFTLVNEYESPRGFLFHMDIYRLAEVSDLTDIGSDELIGSPNGIAVVEWADRALAALPEATIFVRFFHISEISRLLEISAPATIMERLGLMELAKQSACED
jgi:tRNA threonylcarbamoyladenosine biosynthesis protein TsaE